MAWSTEPGGRGTAHLLTFHQLKAEQKRGENPPAGTGRDKTEHSLRVKSNPTCHLGFQLPSLPLRVHFPVARKQQHYPASSKQVAHNNYDHI